MSTLLATGDKYGIDTNRIVVGGDSSGGNLAAAVALKLRDEGKRLAAQVKEPLTCSLLHCGTYANSPGLFGSLPDTEQISQSTIQFAKYLPDKTEFANNYFFYKRREIKFVLQIINYNLYWVLKLSDCVGGGLGLSLRKWSINRFSGVG